MKFAAFTTSIFFVIVASRCIAAEEETASLRVRELDTGGNKHPISDAPTGAPIPDTSIPSAAPSQGPTLVPSNLPSDLPSYVPSLTPTYGPTLSEEPSYSKAPSAGDPSCSASPACAALGLAGDCCPTIDDVFLVCCSE